MGAAQGAAPMTKHYFYPMTYPTTSKASPPDSPDWTALPNRQFRVERPLSASTAKVWNSTDTPPQPASTDASTNPAELLGTSGMTENSSKKPTAAAPTKPVRFRKGWAST